MPAHLKTVSSLKDALSSSSHQTLGFVPTMGALHEGHLSLIETSLSENDATIVSIFINPLQFGPQEDFDAYPRQVSSDLARLETLPVDMVFTPSRKEIFPHTPDNEVDVSSLSTCLCGKTRPHFFKGVTSVVLRLFNLIKPSAAYFGEKDFQQLVIIQKMVRDHFFPIRVVGCPIVRDPNGLALSSRNAYLSETDTQSATYIYKALTEGRSQYMSGITKSDTLLDIMTPILKEGNIQIDYLTIVDASTLHPREAIESDDRIMFAGYVGQTRLIDNMAFQ
ncbi:MAG: pantoate--beta-alanine ligase [Candidatus Margulisbacteria bacterium]|nr:pantoate--beta-alanine ligase [Candidatus Margulisiibacteriota bacterium]